VRIQSRGNREPPPTTPRSYRKRDLIRKAIVMIKRLHLAAVLGALVLAGATACGSDDGGNSASGSGGGGGMKLSVVSPSDGGTVKIPFTVKVNTNTSLGPTSSGKHHVHLYFDGHDTKYEIVKGKTWKVPADSAGLSGVKSGMHTMEVSLRNADHSPAGAEAKIKVMVQGAGGGGAAPSSSSTDKSSDSGGYGY
jgi:hypothetical protein